MNRAETTKFLSELLIRDRFSGMGKYWSREVSIDYGTNRVKRLGLPTRATVKRVYLRATKLKVAKRMYIPGTV